jgi:N-acylneuraminate cytidylyltransferase
MADVVPRAKGGVLALIPARGGSKSVPRKNLVPLNGRPLIAYTIAHALGASRIDRVIVTTDDEEIAAVARASGAEVPFLRPTAISGDFALDVEYHSHALGWLRDNEDYVPEMVVNLRPPHPVRRCATIDRAIAAFAASSADSLRSVRLAEQSAFKMWTVDERGYLSPVAALPGVREPYNLPRQLLPPVYWQDGYIDITRPAVVFEKRSTTGDTILPFIIDEQCVDIDYDDEIAEAERLLALAEREDAVAPRDAGPSVRYPS